MRSGQAEPSPAAATFIRRLEGVIAARSFVMVDYDIRSEHLDAASSITPGLESPTISPLREEGWFAVRSMVKRAEVHAVMDKLYELGGRGILVTDIWRVGFSALPRQRPAIQRLL